MQSEDQALITRVNDFLDEKEALLDVYIDEGSEQALFVASYIHGHFSVIAANVMRAINIPENKQVTVAQWQQQIQLMLSDSINRAINNNELNESDASEVVSMTTALFSKA